MGLVATPPAPGANGGSSVTRPRRTCTCVLTRNGVHVVAGRRSGAARIQKPARIATKTAMWVISTAADQGRLVIAIIVRGGMPGEPLLF